MTIQYTLQCSDADSIIYLVHLFKDIIYYHNKMFPYLLRNKAPLKFIERRKKILRHMNYKKNNN